MADRCPSCGRWSCRPCVVDGIIEQDGKVLLIRRAAPPYKGCYALPGGYVDRDEDALKACEREVLEETGLQVAAGAFVGFYDDPGRDAERQNISLVFEARITGGALVAGDDAAEAGWFPLNDLPELAFDHQQILNDYQARRASS